jgi:rare lipoprotein A
LADQSLEGQASWYGPGFYGQKTTSGDVLQKGTMTAAHSSLPMGTEVKVTRLDTNESVIVEINDREPYKEGTLIDLAQGAAEAIDLDDDGTAQVKIEVID